MRAAKRTSNASAISHTPTKMITPVMSLAPKQIIHHHRPHM
ncbi:hypothetical protein HDG33_002892 [Paraburkholderia sp. Cpub6]|nr:hypothetical protein [Paraburkholderia sp. Cpub6]